MHDAIKSIATVDYRPWNRRWSRKRPSPGKFRRDAAAANRREISGEIRGECIPRFHFTSIRGVWELRYIAWRGYTQVPTNYVNAHEPSIRYLDCKAQSKHLLPRTTRPRDPLSSLPQSPMDSSPRSWALLDFSPSAVAPDIPEGSVYWEQFARPRSFHFGTTGWSATSCTWSSRKFCRWH